MAKKAPPVELTTEEKIAAAKAALFRWDDTPIHLLPAPTRSFEPGEPARIGHLKDVVILEKLYDGYAYAFSCTWTERDAPPVTQYRSTYWMDVHKATDNSAVPRLFSPYRPIPASAGDIDSIMHHIDRGGLVCDPRYQREYVWSEANKDALIESIFDRLDIGAFLFVRHAGFNHPGDETLRDYVTLDGRKVSIKKSSDYTMAIIDGQQRITTIVDFILDRRPYKGVYFSQMNTRDQLEFRQASVMFRIINEEQSSEKEIVRMFLQSNRGVPQAPEHIAKVQALYESMT